MVKRTRVVVYGTSLNLAGIAASLKTQMGLEVIGVDAHLPNATRRLSQLRPAVIAFDLSDPDTSLDIAILREQPGLLLIGMDPANDELLVLSSRPQKVLSVAGLVEIIQQQGHGGQERGA